MRFWFAAFLAPLFLLSAQNAFAQGVPRIKAKVVSFDGKTLTVLSGAETMKLGVLATTRYVRQEDRALADIAEGNYIGATVTRGKDGTLRATEIHLFPEALRGNGEGVVATAGRIVMDATVRTIGAGLIAVAYRGAEGGDGIACTGRAPRNGGCKGTADILVAPTVPVTALVPADKSQLVPGAIIALSVMAGPDGRPVTPGLTFEPGLGKPSAGEPGAGEPDANAPSAGSTPPAAKARGH